MISRQQAMGNKRFKLRLKKDDVVKIMTGAHKGKTGKILKAHPALRAVTIEGIGMIKRHVRPTQLRPKGGTKDVHKPFPVSKVALVSPASKDKTTRIAYELKKDGAKVRIARQANNKEIK